MLPIFQTADRILSQMQTYWASQINPLLSNPLSNGILLENITIINGVNVINHMLSRNQLGWLVSDMTTAITLFRSQPFNSKTLTLTSSGAGLISLYVF